MSKGPKSRRGEKRKQRWIIIFGSPCEDEGSKEARSQIYSSALQARKALVFNAMAADALWLLNLEDGNTEAP